MVQYLHFRILEFPLMVCILLAKKLCGQIFQHFRIASDGLHLMKQGFAYGKSDRRLQKIMPMGGGLLLGYNGITTLYIPHIS